MKLGRFAAVAGLIGGLAWVVKVVIIAAVNPSNGVQPIEGILFGLGLIGPVGAGFAVGAIVGAGRAILAVVLGIGFAALFFILTFAVLDFILTFAVLDPLESPFRGEIRARLVDEMPLLIVGAIWAVVSFGLVMRDRRTTVAS